MMTIPLHGKHANGRYALVDDADYELVIPYSWHVVQRIRPNGSIWGPYAHAYLGGGRAVRRLSLMHRMLMPGVPEIDHKDGNGLNCQRWNLREVTRAQNMANASKRLSNKGLPTSSPWKGVSWREDRGKWRAYIFDGGHQYQLGHFDEETDAARAYDAAAREMFGPFARLNFPQASDLPDPVKSGRSPVRVPRAPSHRGTGVVRAERGVPPGSYYFDVS